MATASASCSQEIPTELIRDLWSRTSLLAQSLPEEENFSRLLPKFCVHCPKRAIGWLEVREVMDVYQRGVFSRDAVQRLLPLHFLDLLYRLQYTLHHCVSSLKPSKWLKTIKKLERKLKKRRRDEVVLKAVGEFPYVLRWIDDLTQENVL